MNKTLIALAVAGAFIAPAAMAQTANPVTLYGTAWATFESVEAKGGATPLARRQRVTDQTSKLGVRGTEDLGGGLSAFFQLETVFKIDQNDSGFAQRNSGVGLQGGFGSILLGRWDTPFKTTTGAIDPYGNQTLGDLTAAMQGSGVGGVNGQFDRREQNVVQYWSPSWAGIAVRLSYGANEGKTATVNPRSSGASITWTGGPMYLGYAYHEFKDIAFIGTAPLAKQEANALFGNFTFGPIKVGALYEEFKRSNQTKQKAWMGNVVFTAGSSQFIYQYQDAKDGGTPGAAQPSCKVNSLGYFYNFSRRTQLQAGYTKIDNNSLGTCNFGTDVLAISAGQDPQGVFMGLRHNF